jgi:spore germination cell wall hydrolase CwlJ-like protein
MLLCTLSGCMASARTMNFYTQDELDARTRAVSAPVVIEITPLPTKPATPFVATPSPSPSPSASPTPTPSPTPSLEPSASPTPAFTVEEIDDRKAYLNAGSANLRTGPGTGYDVVRELSENAKLTVTGESGEWLRVSAGEYEGFVLAEFVEYGSPPTQKPTEKPTTKPTATPKPSATATPKPTATGTPSATATPEPTDTPSGGANDYFTDANGYTADELLLIAQVVHEESKGTSVEAQAAVANAIYNRLKSSKFPDTVEGVIYQKNQYTVVKSKEQIAAVKPSSKAVEAVMRIFVNEDTFLPENVMYFRAASKGTYWSAKYEYYATYGNNCFFIYIG